MNKKMNKKHIQTSRKQAVITLRVDRPGVKCYTPLSAHASPDIGHVDSASPVWLWIQNELENEFKRL